MLSAMNLTNHGYVTCPRDFKDSLYCAKEPVSWGFTLHRGAIETIQSNFSTQFHTVFFLCISLHLS